jgi:hypothetical protein
MTFLNILWRLCAVVTLAYYTGIITEAPALAYEDEPFSFNATVSDSVLMLHNGVIITEFTVKYFSGDPELYINGVPAYGDRMSPKSRECVESLEYWKENPVALALVESGLSCSKVFRLIRSMRIEILWDFADWLDESGGAAKNDSLLVPELQRICNESRLSELVEFLNVVDGRPQVKFIDRNKTYNGVLVSERPLIGDMYKPFRDQALKFAKRMVRVAEGDRRSSMIFGLRGYTIGGPGMFSKGRRQIERMQETGVYVDGPIDSTLCGQYEYLNLK